ncbi:MAG: creatininase family protein [Planctomycetota bacterium]
MLWTELTGGRFGEAVEASGGLCLLPMGCIERHGPHLPLGTDQMVADEVSRRATEREPAVVFPSYYFGKIWTARHYPGAFAARRELLTQVLGNTLEEIARNGFDRILIVNGHGGNPSLLHFFLRSLLAEEPDYAVYATNLYELDAEAQQRWKDEFSGGGEGSHADERETSVMLHLWPELVQMEDLTPPEDGENRGRLEHLEGLDSPLSWYARYPTHYAGDAHPAAPEKGEFLVGAMVERLARQMRAIKSDQTTPELMKEFYSRSDHRRSAGD